MTTVHSMSRRSSQGGTKLWHPFADMARVREHELVMERGEGIWVWDEGGRRYLDATAGLWYTNVGHGRPEIRAAIHTQLERLETHHVFGDYATRPALELASRLSELAPTPDSRVFLGSGGGDAIDTAAKLARLYWARLGQPERRHIVSRTGGYHGTHGLGTSLSGIPVNRDGFGPLVEDTSTVQYDSADALREQIEHVGADRVAAFVFEPVIGSGGLLLPPAGYLEEVASICRQHEILAVADVVISGFGRLGTWFGVERWGLTPDLIAFAKGVTSGYLPLGGVIASARVAEPFWTEPGAAIFRHGQTYAGHATCCAAALANLDVIEAEHLLARSRELEEPLERELRPLADSSVVQEVRAGLGFFGAFDFRDDLLERYPTLTVDAVAIARAAGILARALPRGLAVSPPLIADPGHLALIGEGLRAALDYLETMLDQDENALPLSASDLAGLNDALTPVAA
jgi:putrescine aminotransferase